MIFGSKKSSIGQLRKLSNKHSLYNFSSLPAPVDILETDNYNPFNLSPIELPTPQFLPYSMNALNLPTLSIESFHYESCPESPIQPTKTTWLQKIPKMKEKIPSKINTGKELATQLLSKRPLPKINRPHFLEHTLTQLECFCFSFKRLVQPYKVYYEIQCPSSGQWLQLEAKTSETLHILRKKEILKMDVSFDRHLSRHLDRTCPDPFVDVQVEIWFMEAKSNGNETDCFNVRRVHWWKKAEVGSAHLPETYQETVLPPMGRHHVLSFFSSPPASASSESYASSIVESVSESEATRVSFPMNDWQCKKHTLIANKICV
ncbi:hypothetical protein BDF14DRAFT_1780183 [Spinellus fusiger]|nr:hypothetical protein BDF14DRAFT_1780183 [Spinellus fusiger]